MAIDSKVLTFGSNKVGTISGNLMGFVPPFFPTDISNLVFWLDANYPSDLIFSSGVKVSEWRDKSGNNNHFTQGTIANQLEYSSVTSSVNAPSDTTNFFHMGCTFGSSYTSPQTIIIQISVDTPTQTVPVFFRNVANTLTGGLLKASNEVFILGSTNLTATTTIPVVKKTFMFEINGANTKIFEDNVLKITGSPGTPGFTNQLFLLSNLGGNQRIKCNIFKFLAYNKILTTDEKNDLFNKYLSV